MGSLRCTRSGASSATHNLRPLLGPSPSDTSPCDLAPLPACVRCAPCDQASGMLLEGVGELSPRLRGGFIGARGRMNAGGFTRTSQPPEPLPTRGLPPDPEALFGLAVLSSPPSLRSRRRRPSEERTATSSSSARESSPSTASGSCSTLGRWRRCRGERGMSHPGPVAP